jgi:hypothetical protein
MSSPRRRAQSWTTGYLRFLSSALIVAAAVGAAGTWPTLRLAGVAAIPSLLAGCAVAVIASAVGGLPIALSNPEPVRRPQATLLAMTVRLLTVVLLGLAVLASGWFAARPLMIWTAISYVAQLAVDSRYAIRAAAPAAPVPAAPEVPAPPATVVAAAGAPDAGAADRGAQQREARFHSADRQR